MERQQLAQRYLEGQIGRRVFLRRLIGFGIALPIAIAYADLLRADPAAAVASDYYLAVFDFSYVPTPLKIASYGLNVEWGFQGSSYTHSVTDPTGLIDSGFKAEWNVYDVTMPYSGTFFYHCAETTHPLDPMSGTLKVPMVADPTSGPAGTTFSLNWSTISGGSYSFDVQKKGPSATRWRNWITGMPGRAATFTPAATGIYSFRSRARNIATGVASGWSPVKKITVT